MLRLQCVTWVTFPNLTLWPVDITFYDQCELIQRITVRFNLDSKALQKALQNKSVDRRNKILIRNVRNTRPSPLVLFEATPTEHYYFIVAQPSARGWIKIWFNEKSNKKSQGFGCTLSLSRGSIALKKINEKWPAFLSTICFRFCYVWVHLEVCCLLN